ncbi:Mannosyl-oligosaccharide 1,2-alpha-mannosidase IA [Nowakowskiella sp. JEL0407]|nr:Mannosyl-oligosaccharide 1,2-alpha-mannosidase IA [Nowakowskiella sp. JEL0407]
MPRPLQLLRLSVISIGCIIALSTLYISNKKLIEPRIPPTSASFNSQQQSSSNLLNNEPCDTTKSRIPLFMQSGRRNADHQKMEYVKEMIKHAWDGYAKHAWGADELRPLSLSSFNWYGNYSLLSTPVDSLDTLYIAGLKKEYEAAKKLVLEELDFGKVDAEVSVFETNIRILGGLLSAYELDGDKRLLAKAIEMGDALLPCFGTKSGIPLNWMNLKTGNLRDYDYRTLLSTASLAELGTLQLEFQYLSDVTGNPIYADKSLFALEQVLNMKGNEVGMYTQNIKVDTFQWMSEEYSFAGGGDSFYEYLLKLYISTGEERYWDVYYETVRAAQDHIIVQAPDKKLTYLPITRRQLSFDRSLFWFRDPNFHHLSCFAGGLFAMGAMIHRTGNWTDDLLMGRKITETCYISYNRTRTGLGGEITDALTGDPWSPTYFLRPETIESIFYMWRFTHDPIYREMAWKITQSINKWCRLPSGFSGLSNVQVFLAQHNPQTGEPIFPFGIRTWEDYYKSQPALELPLVHPSSQYPYVNAVQRLDLQESYFLAETLKYLYLIFADDDTIALEKYVFNTEAHPISIRGMGKRQKFTPESVKSNKNSRIPVTTKLLGKYPTMRPFSKIGYEVGQTRNFTAWDYFNYERAWYRILKSPDPVAEAKAFNDWKLDFLKKKELIYEWEKNLKSMLLREMNGEDDTDSLSPAGKAALANGQQVKVPQQTMLGAGLKTADGKIEKQDNLTHYGEAAVSLAEKERQEKLKDSVNNPTKTNTTDKAKIFGVDLDNNR